jgi:hypothetical protein
LFERHEQLEQRTSRDWWRLERERRRFVELERCLERKRRRFVELEWRLVES